MYEGQLSIYLVSLYNQHKKLLQTNQRVTIKNGTLTEHQKFYWICFKLLSDIREDIDRKGYKWIGYE